MEIRELFGLGWGTSDQPVSAAKVLGRAPTSPAGPPCACSGPEVYSAKSGAIPAPMSDPGTDARPLSVELAAAALREVAESWRNLNYTHFRDTLRLPVFRLGAPGSVLGRWFRGTRTLEISYQLMLDHGWGVLTEVLKHEMAHQFVDEVLGMTSESAHGPAFCEVCRARGIDARATGIPQGKPLEPGTPRAEQARVLDRIAKLLALAESPNVHEAHAAALAAQRLMLKYNIDSLNAGATRDYEFRHLGKPTGRLSPHDRALAHLLADHFFVQVIWVPVWRPLEGKRGSVLEVCGTLANVELAAYTHAFLAHTAERLWREHKKSQRLTKDAGRRSFLAGVVIGFSKKLAEQAEHQAEEGLIWVGDAQLQDYFRLRHPRVCWTRGSASYDQESYVQGEKAGRNIVLHRGVSDGPSAVGPRLLSQG